MEMTPRERVLCALDNRQPDRVPIFDFLYSRKLYAEVIGRVPEFYNGEDVMQCAAKIGYDLVVMPLGGFGGIRYYSTASQQYQDEWGTTYHQDRVHAWPADAPVGFPLKERSDWKNFRVPDPAQAGRLREIDIALRLGRETGIAVFGAVRGPFTATWLLFGIERFSLLLYDDPDFLAEVIAACTDFFIEGGRQMAAAGVDGICFADDYGSVNGPFISPAHFEKFILPHLKRLVQAFKAMGLPVMMHSDGRIRRLMDTLVSTGINSYHPIERGAGMDLLDIKQNYGDKICLMGNVDNKTTLVTGSVADVEAQTMECIRIAAPGGGYILASDHSVKDDMPNENIFALYNTGRKYGQYPISI